MERVSILLVDDRPENLLTIEAILEPLGHSLVKVTSGEQALKLLLQREFALILLDVQMPGIDGFETAAHIKQVERTRDIPIIFLTAMSTEPQHALRGYSTGGVDYISKPFDPWILRAKVEVFVDLFRKNRALREAEERYRSIFENSIDGLFQATPGGKILTANPATARIAGFATVPDFLSATPNLFDAFVDQERASELVGLLDGGGDVEGFVFEIHRPLGDRAWVSVNARAVRGPDGEPLAVEGTIIDITERRRLEALREEFIANAAHELRTPIAILLGFTTALAEHPSDLSNEDVHVAIEGLKRQGGKLKTLVDKLLDLSRIHAGRFAPQLRPVPLGETVERVLESVPPPSGIDVKARLDGDVVVSADPDYLDGIFTNLLTNAYKYGGTSVSLEVTQSNGQCVVSVADDGPGVPPAMQEHLFQAFSRGENSSGIHGSGLGLAIARELAESVGGKLSYENADPHGARFLVQLRRVESSGDDDGAD